MYNGQRHSRYLANPRPLFSFLVFLPPLHRVGSKEADKSEEEISDEIYLRENGQHKELSCMLPGCVVRMRRRDHRIQQKMPSDTRSRCQFSAEYHARRIAPARKSEDLDDFFRMPRVQGIFAWNTSSKITSLSEDGTTSGKSGPSQD